MFKTILSATALIASTQALKLKKSVRDPNWEDELVGGCTFLCDNGELPLRTEKKGVCKCPEPEPVDPVCLTVMCENEDEFMDPKDCQCKPRKPKCPSRSESSGRSERSSSEKSESDRTCMCCKAMTE